MRSEAKIRADKVYRNKNAQISITVSKEIKEMVDRAAERTGKSKAQYIVDLIKADNPEQIKKAEES